MAKNVKENHSYTPNIEDTDIYKSVLDTRNFEVTLFWQRSNYFLALNSGLVVGAFLSKAPYSFVLALLGLISSILWYLVNLGSKFWQSRWEQRLNAVEKKIAPNLNLFGADEATVYADVEESLQFFTHNWIHRLFDRQVLWKPSVSLCMTLLSAAFIFSWIAVLVLLSTQMIHGSATTTINNFYSGA